MKTPILGGYAVARSVNAADNRLMNLYPEATPEGGKSSGFLTRCPGYKYLMDVGSGPIRGLWQFANTMYVVSGVELYRVTPDFVATLIGSVSGAGPVSMSDNGEQLFVACNPRSYTYNYNTGAFAEITDEDFPGAVTVGFINGYFVFNEPNSQKVWITEYQNGASIDPLEFSFTDANPDLLISLMVNRNEIWMFGTTSTEVWYYSGDVDFPLARIQGAFNEIGCAAPYSPAKLDNTVFWLGSDPRGNAMVYKAVGYGAQRVSTHGIEKVLQSYEYVADAIGYSYQQEGHTFYVLTFPSANATWVFDAATNEWHERGSWKQGHYNRHRSNCQVNFNNKIILGDFQYGKLYEFDLDYYQDDVGTQRWVRSWRALPPNANNLNRTAHHSLQVELEAGTTEYVTVIPGTPAIPLMLDTINPSTGVTSSTIALSNGDLTMASSSNSSWYGAKSTYWYTTGKYYFEVTDTTSVDGGLIVGLADASCDFTFPGNYVGNFNFTTRGYSWSIWANRSAGVITYGNDTSATPSGTPITTGGRVNVAVDFDAGKMWFGLNGVWVGSGDPGAGTNESYTFTPNSALFAAASLFYDTQVATINFGASAFSDTIPAGFSEWNSNINPVCTWDVGNIRADVTLSNGDLTAKLNTPPSSFDSYGVVSTNNHSEGKKYFEITQDVYSSASMLVGLCQSFVDAGANVVDIATTYLGSTTVGWGLLINDSAVPADVNLYNSGLPTTINNAPLLSNGDVVGVAVDFDAGKAWYSFNGTWIGSGDPAAGTNPAFTFTANSSLVAAVSLYDDVAQATVNFGDAAFEYTPPTGFDEWLVPYIPPIPPVPGSFTKRLPKVLLRWSDDGGHTWSNYHDKDLGALGEYWHRVIWRRLGMTNKLRDRVYELSGADPVKITLTGAELLLSGTNS